MAGRRTAVADLHLRGGVDDQPDVLRVGVCWQGWALHPGSAGRWPATSTAKACIPWDGGVGPVRGR
ncbi:hypothetical protein C7E17_23210, partial [Stenotrophomonas maltophilia]